MKIDKIVNGISESLAQFDNDDKIELITWVKDEYQHFMLTSREAYIPTLDKVISSGVNGADMFKFLRENIEPYGSTKSFYFAAKEMLDKLEIDG